MHRNAKAAILIAVAIGAAVNYLVVQAVMAMPCVDSASCSQRIAGALILMTADIFAAIVVVSELTKKKSLMSKG